MKVNSRNIRDLHVGKTQEEKADYQKLISSDFVFDKTIEDPIDTNKTNSSTVDETKDVVSNEVRKKSLLLHLVDGSIFKNTYVVGILVTVAGFIIWGFISMAIEQGRQKDKIDTIETTVKEEKDIYNSLENDLQNLDKGFSVFKEGVTKDIEYIKAQLKLP